MEWELEWGLVCERGRVRPENQDAVLLWCSPKKGPPLAPELRQAVYRSGCTLVAAVADGMGGVAGGAEASQAVTRTVESAMERGLSCGPQDFLRDLVAECHASVLKESRRRDLEGMGTTLSLVLISGSTVHLLQVGDSRCYRIFPRSVRMVQWSQDQNLAAELVGKGVITLEEAASHPGRHILTEVIGGDRLPSAQLLEEPLSGEEEILLVCSDGLIRVVDDIEILKAFSAACSAEEETDDTEAPAAGAKAEVPSRMQAVAERLLDLANRRGSPDNVSIVAVRLVPRS